MVQNQLEPWKDANIFKKFYFKPATALVKKLPIAPNKLCSNTTKDYYVINLISKSEFQLLILTRCLSIFTTIDEKKEKQKSTLQIFLKKKNWKLMNTVDSR